MRSAISALVVLLVATPGRAQTITPSQTRLIGCFGEAFTLVEHVWRIAPTHLEALAAEAKDAKVDTRKAFLDGFVSGAVASEQAGALAVARNLDGCLDAALKNAPGFVKPVLQFVLDAAHHSEGLNSTAGRVTLIVMLPVIMAARSQQEGRKLYWDPVKERFKNDDEANGLLMRQNRYPYVIPGLV